MAPHEHPAHDSGALRASLCRAVARLAATRGWAEVTPAAIAKAAGRSEEAFHEQFETAEECFLAMYDATAAELGGVVADAVGRSSRELGHGEAVWAKKVDAGLRAALEFMASKPVVTRACVVEALNVGPEVRERREVVLASFMHYLDRLGHARGEPLPALAPEVIARGTHELIYTRVARGETEQLLELLPTLRYLWLVPFLGQEEAARDPHEDDPGPGGGAA